MGLCDGNTSDSVDVRQAIQDSLALGLAGVKGIVADSKAYSQRTLGLCVEQQVGLVTLVPRTCAIRQEVEAWGQQQRSLPLLLEKPGRRRQDTPRRWYGRSVTRPVEVEYADGRVALEPIRFVAVYSNQLAQQHAQAYITAQTQEAEELAQHILQVEARRFACEADAEAAIAEYAGHGPGRRGRRPCRWHSHTVHYQVQTEWQQKKRTRRGRPAKAEPRRRAAIACVESPSTAAPGPHIRLVSVGDHAACGHLWRCRDCAGISRPDDDGGTGLSLDQEPGGDQSGMARKT